MITVIGGGPAGCAAAIACRQASEPVTIVEKSSFPRHKVCGEFLSPEIQPLLTRLGLWDDFAAAKPARYARLGLHFAKRTKTARLSEPAFGLSRYRFDQILADAALGLGATIQRERPDPAPGPVILAHGRRTPAPRGGRHFGFKAHFRGPATDSIELFFFEGGYVGVNCVEGELTNVCGVAREEILAAHSFEPDELLYNFGPLAARTGPLTRIMPWLVTGPLVYGPRWGAVSQPSHYPAGDAICFVDPFTGSGLVNALLTGLEAGRSVVSKDTVARHISRCIRALRVPVEISGAIRWSIRVGIAEALVGVLPSSLLMGLTRPRVRGLAP